MNNVNACQCKNCIKNENIPTPYPITPAPPQQPIENVQVPYYECDPNGKVKLIPIEIFKVNNSLQRHEYESRQKECASKAILSEIKEKSSVNSSKNSSSSKSCVSIPIIMSEDEFISRKLKNSHISFFNQIRNYQTADVSEQKLIPINNNNSSHRSLKSDFLESKPISPVKIPDSPTKKIIIQSPPNLKPVHSPQPAQNYYFYDDVLVDRTSSESDAINLINNNSVKEIKLDGIIDQNVNSNNNNEKVSLNSRLPSFSLYPIYTAPFSSSTSSSTTTSSTTSNNQSSPSKKLASKSFLDNTRLKARSFFHLNKPDNYS
jgi:hypothetical protein